MKLSVEKVTKYYGNDPALNNVSFSIGSGETVGLLGHNGAGKSTLIKCMMNAVKSYTGSISIDGRDIRKNQEILAEECSFLLEPAFCEYLSAEKNLSLIDMVISGHSPVDAESALEMVSLKKAAKKKVGDFSFGMKQRLGLSQVFMSSPHFVILDEPTVGLDPMGTDIIKNLIRKLSEDGVSVLFSSHQINEVFEICTRVIVMKEGQIVYDGGTDDLLRKKYSVKFDRPVNDADFLKALMPSLEVSGCFVSMEGLQLLPELFRCMVEKGYRIVDVEIKYSFEYLKMFMDGEKRG